MHGLASIPASRFPNDKPPTIFSPSSPKSSPTTTNTTTTANQSTPSSNDASSLFSTNSSTSLLKHSYNNLKQKFTSSSKTKESNSDPKTDWNGKTSRQNLTETYAIMAMK